jgi:serralysin
MAAGTKTISFSGNTDIDALIENDTADPTTPIIWNTGNLTYSFPTSASVYSYSGEPGTFTAIVPDDTNLLDAIPQALKLFSQYANLTFTKTTGSSDLRFAETDFGGAAAGRGYFPGDSAAQSGDVWYDPGDSFPIYIFQKDFMGVMHEIGHALGLSHPGLSMDPSHVGWDYTIMSYASFPDAPTILTGDKPQTPMLADVAALQYMYGANFNTNAGNTTYTWSPAFGQMFINGHVQDAILSPDDNKIYMTLWDGGGIDTFDFSNYTTNVKVDLRPGEWSSPSPDQIPVLSDQNDPNAPLVLARGSIANPFLYNNDPRSLIENANGGSGNDSLIGNQANNVLNGNGGDDTFFYTGGVDTFNGGTKGTSGDTADFSLFNSGVIVTPVPTTTTLRLPNGQTFTIVLSETSSTADAGAHAYDVSYFTEVGPIHIVNLTGMENITGSAFADTITGNADDNVIKAGNGNDHVFYTGGLDTIDGGNGTDTIDFSQFISAVSVGLTPSTVFPEAVTTDTTSWQTGTTLRPIAELAGFENAVGTQYDDALLGNSGNNTLDGGAGNDSLYYDGGVDILNGNTGNDTADFSRLSNIAVSVDLAGGGFEARANGTTNLTTGNLVGIADLQSIENVTGTSVSDIIRGDSGANIINGGSGADTLAGRGGNDTINGGPGNDTYEFLGTSLGSDKFFDESGTADKIVIDDLSNLIGALRDGNDLIIKFSSSGGFRIIDHFAGHAIENLQDRAHGVVLATSTVGGDGSGIIAGGNGGETLDGRGGDDFLFGGNGSDRLIGGDGNDRLTGGNGGDTFVFGPSFGLDVVTDFTPADRIEFDGGVFGNFKAVQAASQQVGNDTVITLDPNDSITLQDVALKSLRASHFSFAPAASPSPSTGAASAAPLPNMLLLGSYMASTFVAASDGHGSSVVADPAAFQGAQPLVTLPHA